MVGGEGRGVGEGVTWVEVEVAPDLGVGETAAEEKEGAL